jgi:hypothetical protein
MWDSMSPNLDERQRRLFAATLAGTYGYRGATVVHEVTGIALNTITAGKKDIAESQNSGRKVPNSEVDSYRTRKPGGGPKTKEYYHPNIMTYVADIVNATTYGNPVKNLSYTTESLRKIGSKLALLHDIDISAPTVGSILEKLGYSKQCNQKMEQVGVPHPDRNAQFEFINLKSQEFLDSGDPIISVDTKKKELIGNFKNNGSEYRKKHDPRRVLDHDFPIKELGKVAPYGVYNLNHNIGFVNLGSSHDTAEFAVESISRWWQCIGKDCFPKAKRLFITCDSGGSNGSRVKLWKYQLFQFAQRINLDIHISHFPPGTSKWNKIEHRLFCYISKNWQGKPLIDIQTAVDLIGSTTTNTGLKVTCETVYNLKIKVSDEDFESIELSRIDPFGDWNYIIHGR